MRRRVAAAFFAGLLALALAACGGGGSSAPASTPAATTQQSATDVLASASEKARSAGSSKIALSVSLPLPGKTAPSTLTGDGAFDYANERGTLNFDVGDLLSGLAGGALGGSSKLQLVLDKNVLYLNFPALGQLLGGKPWIKLDPAELSKQQGLNLGQLQTIGQSDPSAFLDYLGGVASLQRVGTETVRGTETTHYKAEIDFDKVLANAPADAKAGLKATIDQLAQQTGKRSVPVDVWVGNDGLVRKIMLSYPAVAGSTGSPSTVTVELYDFGTPVNVTVPPADQVTDFAQIAALAGMGSSSTSGSATATVAPTTTVP